MRIIFLTSKLNFETAGGSVADAHLKAKGLVDLGHTVTVITAFSSYNKINQTLPYKVIEEHIASSKLLSIQYGAYKILKKYQNEADIFYIDGHIFVYGGGSYRLLGGNTPVVAFFNIRLNAWGDTQNTKNRKTGIVAEIKRSVRKSIEYYLGVHLANRLDAFVFNTPMLAKKYFDWGFATKKSSIIEDFVDTSSIQAEMHNEKKISKQEKSEGPVIILCSGRMIPEKGFDLVIKALGKIKEKEHIQTIMSGGGPEYDRLKTLTQEMGLEKYISLPGWVEKSKLQEFFKQAHVFIFPKWWSEYGSAVLTEAFAYGLPSIIPSGGALEWLSGRAAISFTPDSVDELAKQIELLSRDRQLRLTLTKETIQRTDALDYKELAARLEKVMQGVASKTDAKAVN